MGQEAVKSAQAYFKSISRPFFEFLETKSVAETHDIADASLFVLMALEESRWYGAGVGLTLFVKPAREYTCKSTVRCVTHGQPAYQNAPQDSK